MSLTRSLTVGRVSDLLDPVGAPSASLVYVAPMLFGSVGAYPQATMARRVVTDVFLTMTVLSGGVIS